MPLFHHKSHDEKEREAELHQLAEQHAVDQQESLRLLEQGGLPVQATRRLTELREGANKPFTSDLSVAELLSVKHEGLTPLSQVMGSAFYHVGWSSMGMNYYSSGEMGVISQAFRNARHLALDRMRQEAKLIGADAVVGVHLRSDAYDWGANCVEFTAFGTAVRVQNAPPAAEPALSNLSGQEFFKLTTAGYWPTGIVAGTCVFYQVATWRTQSANWWGTGAANQELVDFSQAMMLARHLACNDLQSEALRAGSHGVVGMNILDQAREHEVEINDTTRTDMIFTFNALGTGLVPLSKPVAPTKTLPFVSLAGRGNSRLRIP